MSTSEKINIAVVIPCYNCSETIEQCINSVFTQSFQPKEIIVIDDGSKDATIEKLNKLKELCPPNIKFVVLQQENSGPSVARNKGVAAASTEWIAFLDSDDYWEKRNLEYFDQFIKEHENFVLVGGGKVERFEEIPFKKLLFKNFFQTSCTLAKKDIMEKYKFNERQKYSEDFRSWLLIAEHHKVCRIPGMLALEVKPDVRNGLSSKLWKMEKGELSNFWYLRKKKSISLPSFIFVCSYSYIKFLKRVFMQYLSK
ncbi:MAG: glycosyltransferase family 2 protein [Chryseobacterium jejuense]|uniref:glycosyltransferase family 2 protein n=1 Tax=Chryseobacterium jejuense TaxID=445960 RepID=UPI003D136BC2